MNPYGPTAVFAQVRDAMHEVEAMIHREQPLPKLDFYDFHLIDLDFKPNTPT